MCQIIASPTGKRISDKILEESAASNGHGGGLAWLVDDNKIKFRKGLDVKGVKELLDGEAKGLPWVVHFRIATHGPICDELTHPFTIDARASVECEGEADSVLFHNGTFPNWKEYLLQAVASSGTPLPEQPWSDSRAVAFVCHVYGKHVLSILENSSRFLVFDAKEKKDHRIMLWGTWHDYDVFKFSNRGTSAFSTYADNRSSSSSSRGGGSENPQRDAAEDEGAAEESNTQVSTKPSTSERLPSSTTPHSAASSAKAFKPKAGYDCWRSFGKDGVHVRGTNEPQSAV
jgi:hypothetical protein